MHIGAIIKLVIFSEEPEPQLFKKKCPKNTKAEELRLDLKGLWLEFVLLNTANKLYTLCTDYCILPIKTEMSSCVLCIHLYIPVFTLFLNIGYLYYYSVWLNLFMSGDVWENIAGMKIPSISSLCRVYDGMPGSRSTLQPRREALQIRDLLGYRCISE